METAKQNPGRLLGRGYPGVHEPSINVERKKVNGNPKEPDPHFQDSVPQRQALFRARGCLFRLREPENPPESPPCPKRPAVLSHTHNHLFQTNQSAGPCPHQISQLHPRPDDTQPPFSNSRKTATPLRPLPMTWPLLRILSRTIRTFILP